MIIDLQIPLPNDDRSVCLHLAAEIPAVVGDQECGCNGVRRAEQGEVVVGGASALAAVPCTRAGVPAVRAIAQLSASSSRHARCFAEAHWPRQVSIPE